MSHQDYNLKQFSNILKQMKSLWANYKLADVNNS